MQIPHPEISFEFILFSLFVLVVIDQLIYYWGVFSKISFYQNEELKTNNEAVSIVICAKNEYANLKKNLPKILNQDHKNFEVVVVNDASDDYTHELLEDMDREYAHLKIVNIRQNLNFFSGKKFALSIGIKSAKNDLLLLTDADCSPVSDQWINKMIAPFTNKDVEIVLGYGPYEHRKGFLNKIIRFDTLMVAIQYFSFSLMKKTYMGVGRNLAYRKSMFIRNGGFISHYNLNSGDDDLFINRVATKTNTKIQIDPESFTFSEPKVTYGKWLTQKRRHLTTAKYYKPYFKFVLGKYGLGQLLFFTLFAVLMSLNYCLIFVGGLFLLRIISQYIILNNGLKRLKEPDLLLFSPLLELLLFFNQLLLSASNVLFKQTKWK